MKDWLSYLIFIFFRMIMRWSPFWLLYRYADGLYFLLFYLIRYRRAVVRRNLTHAFPHHAPTAIRQLEKKAYRHFCDCMLETLKGLTASPRTLCRRWQLTNPELLNQYFNNNQSIVAFGGHYGNWEWGISLSNQIQHRCVQFYKPLHLSKLDKVIKAGREHTGTIIRSAQTIQRTLIKERKSCCCFALIADQSPGDSKNYHWMTFLHQDTAALMGPELIAKTFDYPVIYLHGERVKRGFYRFTAHLISDTPQQTPEGAITEACMRHLEHQINTHPPLWLWTHNRWKMKKPPLNA